jgi:hypothetical protein
MTRPPLCFSEPMTTEPSGSLKFVGKSTGFSVALSMQTKVGACPPVLSFFAALLSALVPLEEPPQPASAAVKTSTTATADCTATSYLFFLAACLPTKMAS